MKASFKSFVAEYPALFMTASLYIYACRNYLNLSVLLWWNHDGCHTDSPLSVCPIQLMTQDITGLRAFKLIFVSVWDMNLTLWDLSINFVGSINMQNSAVKENICLQHYSYILQTACHKIIIKLIRDILYVITQWVCISIKEIVKQILIILYIFIYFHFHFDCLLYKLCQS